MDLGRCSYLHNVILLKMLNYCGTTLLYVYGRGERRNVHVYSTCTFIHYIYMYSIFLPCVYVSFSLQSLVFSTTCTRRLVNTSPCVILLGTFLPPFLQPQCSLLFPSQVRFLADLVNAKVVSSSSIMALFDTFLTITYEPGIPQVPYR